MDKKQKKVNYLRIMIEVLAIVVCIFASFSTSLFVYVTMILFGALIMINTWRIENIYTTAEPVIDLTQEEPIPQKEKPSIFQSLKPQPPLPSPIPVATPEPYPQPEPQLIEEDTAEIIEQKRKITAAEIRLNDSRRKIQELEKKLKAITEEEIEEEDDDDEVELSPEDIEEAKAAKKERQKKKKSKKKKEVM